MTLKARNYSILTLLAISIIYTLFIVITYIFAILKQEIIPPQYSIRIFNFHNFFMLKYNFSASLIAILLFLIYSIAALSYIYIRFEKTQSTEVFYFCGFLLGCLLESSRIFIPVFGLWIGFSSQFIFIGKLILFGKLVSAFSILLCTIASANEQRQYIERNTVLMITISLLLTLLVPLNTNQITSTCSFSMGFSSILQTFRIFAYILSVLSLYITSNTKDSIILKNATKWLAFCITGYFILNVADNILFTIAGASILFSSTFLLLKNIHNSYS